MTYRECPNCSELIRLPDHNELALFFKMVCFYCKSNLAYKEMIDEEDIFIDVDMLEKSISKKMNFICKKFNEKKGELP